METPLLTEGGGRDVFGIGACSEAEVALHRWIRTQSDMFSAIVRGLARIYREDEERATCVVLMCDSGIAISKEGSSRLYVLSNTMSVKEGVRECDNGDGGSMVKK